MHVSSMAGHSASGLGGRVASQPIKKQSPPALHLFRNKRRRLSITPVEIDPDAEAGLAEGAAATGAGGGGSAASMLCARPSGGASSVLDF
jgi:hypothetical protein